MTHLQVLQLVLMLCASVLAYVYAIFPLIMGLIGHFSAPPVEDEPSPEADLPSVSLLIPAYNEEHIIASKIRNALELDYPQHLIEIIVGCDGATDATAEIAIGFESDRLHVMNFLVRRGKASVINDAASKATGEVLCLCDANVIFAPDSLKRLIAHLSSPDVGAASGDVRLDSVNSSFGAAESLYYWMERSIHRGESRLGSMMGVDGGMYVVRRELFQPLAEDTILDDFTISMHVIRRRQRIQYEPKAIAFENATEAATTEFNRRVRLSCGAAQVIRRRFFPPITQPIDFLVFVSHKLLRWFSPFVILVTAVLFSVLAIHDLRYLFVVGALLVIVIAATLGAFSRRLRRHMLFAVPFFFAMSQIAMAYGMCKGFFGRADAKWERTERQTNISRADSR